MIEIGDTFARLPSGLPWSDQDRIAQMQLDRFPAHRMLDQRKDGGELWCMTCESDEDCPS